MCSHAWGDRTGNRRPLLGVLVHRGTGFQERQPAVLVDPAVDPAPTVLAPAVAIINSLGNLGGFVAPYGFGLIKFATGEVTWGLYAPAAASALAAASVLLIKKNRHVELAPVVHVEPGPISGHTVTIGAKPVGQTLPEPGLNRRH